MSFHLSEICVNKSIRAAFCRMRIYLEKIWYVINAHTAEIRNERVQATSTLCAFVVEKRVEKRGVCCV